MTTSSREIEDKYDVDEFFALPELAGTGAVASVGEPTEIRLEAMYFDTDDLRLATAGVTLRRRLGGADEGWHLKLATTPRIRTEVRRPPGRSTRTVPIALRRLVRGITRDAPLAPVARLSTVRAVRELFDADDSVLAELCDDRVSAEELGSTATLSNWREVEVELIDGDLSVLEAVGPALVAAGARPATHPSKLARVLGGRLRARRPVEPSDPASAGAVIWRALHRQIDALRGHEPLVRQDELDSVHQMRVAVRTLRSLLAAYRPLFDRAVTEPIRAELKWLGGVLGPARDAEVMGDRLHGLALEQSTDLLLGPVLARIDSVQRGTYRDARAAVVEELNGDRYVELLDSLDELLRHPPFSPLAARPARKVLPARVAKAWRRLEAAVAVAHEPGLTGPEQAVALHQARKAAKRVRYATVATGSTGGSAAATFAKRIKKVQSALGDHQDSVLSRELLRTLGVQAHLAGENGFTYGLLYAAEERRAADDRRLFDRIWSKASRKRQLRWLG
jgi:CHAD domain-containing protein